MILKKDKDEKEEEKREEVRKTLVCPNCNSSYVYSLADGSLKCRKCGYLSVHKKN
jgi:ribosomal protein L37AE/L43A